MRKVERVMGSKKERRELKKELKKRFWSFVWKRSMRKRVVTWRW